MERQHVIQSISAAWGAVAAPTREEIAYDNSGKHLECNAVAEFFAGKPWQAVTWSCLQAYKGDAASCLYFMSPQAFRYYLASYLAIALSNPVPEHQVADSAWKALAPPVNPQLVGLWQQRIAGLTAGQRQAILGFIEFMRHEHGNDYPYGEENSYVLQHWQAAL